MLSAPLLYSAALFLLPLSVLVLLRFRLTPAVLLLALLHHHPMEPLPGDHHPAPLCCALAKSTAAEAETRVVVTRRVFRAAVPPRPLVRRPAPSVKPAIRAPPWYPLLFPTPWAPVFRAA